MVYCYHIPSNYTLPWGCIISLDDIGLPATPRIYHNAGECLCSGRQDEILLKQLDNWRTDGAARLMQIDPRCAAMVVIQLIDRWELGTAGWTEGLQGDVETLKSRVARSVLPNNPLANGRIEKRRKKPNTGQELCHHLRMLMRRKRLKGG